MLNLSREQESIAKDKKKQGNFWYCIHFTAKISQMILNPPFRQVATRDKYGECLYLLSVCLMINFSLFLCHQQKVKNMNGLAFENLSEKFA